MNSHGSDTILFYTDIPRLFRSTLIGYLYEIAHTFPVVVLTEKLDPETKAILCNKTFFPQLKAIISVNQLSPAPGLREQHKKMHRLARQVVKDYAPKVVIATGTYPFESYLRRYAKQSGATTISAIGPLYGETKKRDIYHILNTAHKRTFSFFPFWGQEAMIRFYKYSAHIVYYWVLPLSLGNVPFIKQPSFPLMGHYKLYKGGADYYIVNLALDCDALIREGVPKEKLLLVAHPLLGPSRILFEKIYFAHARGAKNASPKRATIIWPYDEVGFRDDTHALIPEGVIEETNKRIVLLTSRILCGWKIIIKAHPARPDASKIKRIFKKYANIEVANPLDPIDEYIETSDVVIGPSPVSTALYTASLQCPQKPILSLDFHKLLLGDSFKRIRGIDYIDNEKGFVAALTSIHDGSYRKKKNSVEEKTFSGIVEAIQFIEKRHVATL